jgi:hypothetical protein
MEELATNRIVPQPGGRLGGREICAPICGRLGTINASFLKADPGVWPGAKPCQHSTP